MLPHAVFNCAKKVQENITEISLKSKSEAILHGACHD